jgi:hypothetical protein
MEVGTHEAARKASRPRINARRDDLDPLCHVGHLTNRLGQMATNLSSHLPCKILINLLNSSSIIFTFFLIVDLYIDWYVDHSIMFVNQEFLVEICKHLVVFYAYYFGNHEKGNGKAHQRIHSQVNFVSCLILHS